MSPTRNLLVTTAHADFPQESWKQSVSVVQREMGLFQILSSETKKTPHYRFVAFILTLPPFEATLVRHKDQKAFLKKGKGKNSQADGSGSTLSLRCHFVELCSLKTHSVFYYND